VTLSGLTPQAMWAADHAALALSSSATTHTHSQVRVRGDRKSLWLRVSVWGGGGGGVVQHPAYIPVWCVEVGGSLDSALLA